MESLRQTVAGAMDYVGMGGKAPATDSTDTTTTTDTPSTATTTTETSSTAPTTTETPSTATTTTSGSDTTTTGGIYDTVTNKGTESSTTGTSASNLETSSDTPATGIDTSSSKIEKSSDAPTVGAGTTQHDSEEGAGHDDPSLVGSSEKGHTKMSGTGAPGSHSALFGLVPDEKIKKEMAEKAKKDEDSYTSESTTHGHGDDIGSRGAAGAEVVEQMHDPRVNERATDK